MRSKKGAELSMNVVIIAAICLIVLIVLIVIFSTKSRDFSGGVNRCETLGGVCNAYTGSTTTMACKSGYASVTFGSCGKDSGGNAIPCCKSVMDDDACSSGYSCKPVTGLYCTGTTTAPISPISGKSCSSGQGCCK